MHEPGYALHEAMEQYASAAGMDLPQARSMQAALACTDTPPATAGSHTIEEVKAMLAATSGQDRLAWTMARGLYDGSEQHLRALAPLVLGYLPQPNAPLEPILTVLTQLLQSPAVSSLWESSQHMPLNTLTHVLEHEAFDRLSLPCLNAFFVHFLEALYAYSMPVYDEALKCIMQHLLERRQHAHYDEQVRSSSLIMGAMVLEHRITKCLDAALTHTSRDACVVGDASLALVFNLYAVTLVEGGLACPRLARCVGLALVHDAIKAVNACLYISSTSQYIQSVRKQNAQESSSDSDERVFAHIHKHVGAFPVPTCSERLWQQISLVLASDEAHQVPQVVSAYFLHALSIVAPFFPAPVVEAHMPKSLSATPSRSYEELASSASTCIIQTRHAMSSMAEAFMASLARVQDTFARMPLVCVCILPCIGASPHPELSNGADTIFHALGDSSYTRFESMHMLWIDARAPAVYGARHFLALFLLAAHHVAWSLPLARASVSMLDDMLHVLCDRNMGVLLPYIPWGAGGSGDDVLAVWTNISECIAAMFGRIPEWSRTADRQEMLQWIAHVPMLASYMVQSADLASRSHELESHVDEVYGALAWPLDCAIGWLRLNHEELLLQLSDYIRRTVRLFATHSCVLPGHVVKHAVEFLGQQLGVTNVQQRKTLLSSAQMELLLEEFIALSRAPAKPKAKPKLMQQTLTFAPRPASDAPQRKKPIVVDLTRDSPKMKAQAPAPAPRPAKAQPTSKLAQLRNEFQLTRAVARKPHAPPRAFEPDEPRAPLATSSVTGAVTAVARPKVREPSPPSEDSCSSSDEDEGSGGLAALASPRKTKDQTARHTVKPMIDPALQEAMRKAEDEQRRRRLTKAPTLAPMHECILSWDMHAKSPLPPTRLEGEPFAADAPLPGLTDAASYVERFGTLLTLEAWAQFQQACGDVRDAVAVDIQYVRQSRVDNFVHFEFTTTSPVPAGQYYNETDIVCLELPSRAIRLTANVLFSKRASGQTSTLDLGVQCVHAKVQVAMPYMHEPGWRITKLFTLTTLRREYAALCSVPDLSLVQDVLHARVAPIPDVSKADEAKAMQAYQLNAPQARAVVAAMRTLGFALIQGPPGTGKTKTIRALVASFLARRAGTSIGAKKASTGPPMRMLLCAPSNAAIDELVGRIKDGVEVDGKRIVPRLVRLGRDEAVHPAVRDVTLDALAEHAGANSAPSRANEELQRVEQAWREKRAELETAPSKASPEHARKLQAELNELTDRRFELREQVSSLQSRNKMGATRPGAEHHMARMSILDEAEIVCATLAGAGHEMLYRYTFDTVVIDEAAQAVELSTLIPLRYECTRCILVGDPKQLPPTVLSQEAQRRQYDQSLFVRMFDAAPDRVHLLSIQYRMHPDISLFPSTAFYQRQLIDGPNMAQLTAQPWHTTELFGPFRFFDVHAPEEAGRSHSLQNVAEVNVALQVYEALCTCAKSTLGGRIAFISMYKAQVDLLRLQFTKRFGRAITMEMDFSSVDGFQGQEKDIIIISCVRSNHQGTLGFLTDYRRLNVALTRARSNMIVIGNADMLSRDKIWHTMISEAREYGFLLPVTARTFDMPMRPAPRSMGRKALPKCEPGMNAPSTVSNESRAKKIKTEEGPDSDEKCKATTAKPKSPARARPNLKPDPDTIATAKCVQRPMACDPRAIPTAKPVAKVKAEQSNTDTISPAASVAKPKADQAPHTKPAKTPAPISKPVQLSDRNARKPTPISAPGEKRKSEDVHAPRHAPPRVVPSSSLLAGPKVKPKPQSGKWTQIVERNKAKPATPIPTPKSSSRSNEGPSWLRSARPNSLQKRP